MERFRLRDIFSVLALATSVYSFGLAKSSMQEAEILMSQNRVLQDQVEQTFGWLCNETNLRGNQRIRMTLDDCRKYQPLAYKMAMEVPTPTPLPELYRQLTQVPIRRGGP